MPAKFRSERVKCRYSPIYYNRDASSRDTISLIIFRAYNFHIQLNQFQTSKNKYVSNYKAIKV